MHLSVREVAKVNVLSVDGQIDINSSEIIETVGWLLKHNRLKIVCDLGNVTMLDYSGLSILAITYKSVINHKGQIIFCCVPLHVQQLFRLVRLEDVFLMYDTEELAIKGFDTASKIEQLKLRRRFKRLDMHREMKYYILSNNSSCYL